VPRRSIPAMLAVKASIRLFLGRTRTVSARTALRARTQACRLPPMLLCARNVQLANIQSQKAETTFLGVKIVALARIRTVRALLHRHGAGLARGESTRNPPALTPLEHA